MTEKERHDQLVLLDLLEQAKELAKPAGRYAILPEVRRLVNGAVDDLAAAYQLLVAELDK